MRDKMNQHLLLSLTNARPNAAGFLPMTASGGTPPINWYNE